jgi:hypothetical protein
MKIRPSCQDHPVRCLNYFSDIVSVIDGRIKNGESSCSEDCPGVIHGGEEDILILLGAGPFPRPLFPGKVIAGEGDGWFYFVHHSIIRVKRLGENSKCLFHRSQ